MNELATVDVIKDSPQVLSARGKDLATACRDIVLATAVDIQGKRYVKVEGWQSLAAAWGCTPEIVSLVREHDGVRAEAILKRDTDGAILSRAYGFVGFDEDEEKAMYAVEAKAQTRAVSRVCRNKFAFVLVMIDRNLETTPADELPRQGFKNAKPVMPRQILKGELVMAQEPKEEGGYFNGEVKGIRFGTKDKELGARIMFYAGAPVVAMVEEKTAKNGKTWFALVSVEPDDEDAPADIPPTSHTTGHNQYAD